MPSTPALRRRSTMRIWASMSRSRNGPSQTMRTLRFSSRSRSAAARNAPRCTDCQCSCVSPFGITTMVMSAWGAEQPAQARIAATTMERRIIGRKATRPMDWRLLLSSQILRSYFQHAVRVQRHDVNVACFPLANAEDHVLGRHHVAEFAEPAVEGQRFPILSGELGEIRIADGHGAVVARGLVAGAVADQVQQLPDLRV